VVAIPAVAMNNFYQRISRSILANTDALSHVLLSYLAGVEAGHAPPPPATLAVVSKTDKAKARHSAAPAAEED
jgi:biopolymer transport protein ExbB